MWLTLWESVHLSSLSQTIRTFKLLLPSSDISSKSIEQCKERYNERSRSFKGEFYAADAFQVNIKELVKGRMFHFVSCQFALHYAFESEARIRSCLRGISENMKLYGIFVGTIPDANLLVYGSVFSPF